MIYLDKMLTAWLREVETDWKLKPSLFLFSSLEFGNIISLSKISLSYTYLFIINDSLGWQQKVNQESWDPSHGLNQEELLETAETGPS